MWNHLVFIFILNRSKFILQISIDYIPSVQKLYFKTPFLETLPTEQEYLCHTLVFPKRWTLFSISELSKVIKYLCKRDEQIYNKWNWGPGSMVTNGGFGLPYRPRQQNWMLDGDIDVYHILYLARKIHFLIFS